MNGDPMARWKRQPCPECSNLLDTGDEDGTVECPECRSWFMVTWDVEGATFRRLDPPDAHDVQGCLRQHDAL